MSAVAGNSCLSGSDFGDSLAQGNEELCHYQNLCLSGSDFGDSLAQGDKELWCSQNSCVSASRTHSNFMLWVSFLAGVTNWK